MEAVVYVVYASPDVLRTEDVPTLRPEPHNVVITLTDVGDDYWRFTTSGK